MELDLRNPIDWLIFVGIVLVIVGLIWGAVALFDGSPNWKRHIDVVCDVMNDSIWLRLDRNGKSDNYYKIESITLRITPTKGSSFNYTFEPNDTISPYNHEEYYISFEKIFDGRNNSDKTVEEFKVTKIKLVKTDKY